VAFFPIDTVKTRLQAREGFLKAGGFNGIYKGLGSVLVGSAPGAAAFFTSYEYLKTKLPKLIPALQIEEAAPFLHMLAASGGEAAACIIRVPTEVIKQRQQTSTYGVSASSFTALKRTLAESGIQGLYRGYLSTIAREIPFCCIQFPLYEYLKTLAVTRHPSLRTSKELPAWPDAALCGSISGAIAAGLTTPLDVAKTRIMLSRTTSNHSSEAVQGYDKILPTLRRVYVEEGGGALFRGLAPRVVWIGLGGSVFLGVYEAVRLRLERSTVATLPP